MRYDVFDDKDGIILQIDFENGLAIGLKMDDEAAQELVEIIQNKLNARL